MAQHLRNLASRKPEKTARALALFLLPALVACAAPRAKIGQGKDLFSDPAQFESLASRAYENPVAAPPAGLASLTEPSTTEPSTSFSAQNLISGVSPDHFAMPSVEADTITRVPVTAHAHVASETAMTPELAFSNLIRGNDRFSAGVTKGEHRDEARRRSLASSQNPSTIILSCSDSRVPPELIFDQGLGDLFTIRVAGNVLGSAQVASIEYAIEHLGAKLVVVMGHESCGAVKAALGAKPNVTSGSTDLDWLIDSIKPNIKPRGLASVSIANGGAASDPKLRQPVMANVDAVTEQLMVRSHIISHAMSEGHLKVVRGIYSLETGKVDFWGLK